MACRFYVRTNAVFWLARIRMVLRFVFCLLFLYVSDESQVIMMMRRHGRTKNTAAGTLICNADRRHSTNCVCVWWWWWPLGHCTLCIILHINGALWLGTEQCKLNASFPICSLVVGYSFCARSVYRMLVYNAMVHYAMCIYVCMCASDLTWPFFAFLADFVWAEYRVTSRYLGVCVFEPS